MTWIYTVCVFHFKAETSLARVPAFKVRPVTCTVLALCEMKRSDQFEATYSITCREWGLIQRKNLLPPSFWFQRSKEGHPSCSAVNTFDHLCSTVSMKCTHYEYLWLFFFVLKVNPYVYNAEREWNSLITDASLYYYGEELYCTMIRYFIFPFT